MSLISELPLWVIELTSLDVEDHLVKSLSWGVRFEPDDFERIYGPCNPFDVRQYSKDYPIVKQWTN